MTKPDLHTAKALDNPLVMAYDDAVALLQNGSVGEEHGLMSWGSNYTFLISIEKEDRAMLAIYKPKLGERPLWDFPDGTLYQREIAACTLSEALGWYIVPPTIESNGKHGVGSVQVFIDHDPQQHYFTFDDTHEDQIMRFAAFDAMINNADRKGGHCLIDDADRIWGIDHGLTFHSMNKLRTVIWDYAGQAIPQYLLEDIDKLCKKLEDDQDPHAQQLQKLLSGREYHALQTRVSHLMRNKCYPQPGPGPNRPWPAV